MAVSVTIYKNQLFEQLSNKNANLEGLAFYNLNQHFEKQKKDSLLYDFDKHEVTKEMLAGPEKESSDILPGGYGNLYAFLGFHQGTDVIGIVRNILNTKTKLLPTLISRTKKRGSYMVIYEYAATVPTMEEFASNRDLRPPDWGSKSWIEYIENGVPNFAYFIFNRKGYPYPPSRSRTGLEVKNRLRETDNIPPIKYISKILEEFLDYIDARYTKRT